MHDQLLSTGFQLNTFAKRRLSHFSKKSLMKCLNSLLKMNLSYQINRGLNLVTPA